MTRAHTAGVERDTRPHLSIFTLPGDAPAPGDTTRRSDVVLPLPPPPGQEPERVGGYRIVRELGRGGMGVVYLVEAVALQRPVALKVLVGGDAELVDRFQLEARTAARVKHPNVVGVHEVGRDGSRWFLAMDLVDGESLRARLLRDGPLEPREAARVAEAIGRALQQAHTLGVLHRDVKPHNILVARDGIPLLADFGLAKDVGASGITATGDVLGTPAYMSPEQAMSDLARVDRRTDVYSLGATLYEALTGRPPFQGVTAINVLRQVIEDAPEPPSRHRRGLDRDLQTIVLACLEKDPAARYDTAGELADDLGRWLRHEPITARPQGAWVRAAKWARRRPLGATVVGLSMVAATVAVTAALVVRVERAAERARVRSEALDALAVARVASQTDDQRHGAGFDALAAAQRWLRNAPDDAEATAAVVDAAGLAAAAARRVADTRALLEAHTVAAGLRPGDADLARARDAAAELVRWSRARNDGDAAGARHALERAVALADEWPEPWIWLAMLHEDFADYGSALTAVAAAEARGGQRAEVLRVRAHLLVKLGDVEGGLRACDELLELRESAPAHAARAELAVRRGDLAGAVADLTAATRLQPEVAQRWRRRAEVRADMGDPGHLDDFLEAVRRGPSDPLAWIGLGKAYGRAGRLDEALEALDEAVRVAPTLAQGWWGRAAVHATRGDREAALRDLDEALRLAPGDMRYLADRAGFTITSDPAAAERSLDQAIKTVPDSVPGALARRAEARRLQGRFEAAVDDAAAAIAINPEVTEAWLVRGRARVQLGRHAEAAADLQRFLELSPAHDAAPAARALLERLRRR